MDVFSWASFEEFGDRTVELARLEQWWSSDDKEPINLFGRRRVGKSWLFRRFAHGKPAVLLVADRISPGEQLRRFADQLAPILGLTPRIDDLGDLIRVLPRLVGGQRALVVIDELPFLLGTGAAEVERSLSQIQAALEETRDDSPVKLLLCGSAVTQMQALAAGSSPLHGRLIPIELRRMTFGGALELLETADAPTTIERYAVSGGMPRALRLLGHGELRTRIIEELLTPDARLWNEPRLVLAQELREPARYFSILGRLTHGPQDLATISAVLDGDTKATLPYLTTLQQLRLISRTLPFGAEPHARTSRSAARRQLSRVLVPIRVSSPERSRVGRGTVDGVRPVRRPSIGGPRRDKVRGPCP